MPEEEQVLNCLKSYTLMKMGKVFKNNKCDLKMSIFSETKTAAQVMAEVPSTVIPEDFAVLVDYWYSSKDKVLINIYL
jgi:N-acetylmuramic acid 6-phosphate (MurNAc-6-P) etherase